MFDLSPLKPGNQPLVSVITPSYNAMPFIVETLRSVRDQNYAAIEHIVVDGGSTDGTLEVLQQSPGLVWVSEPDRGQSEALNKGFRKARGEIIGWLNADDSYSPGAMISAVHYLHENPDVDIVYGDVKIMDDKSRVVGVSRSRPFNFQSLLFDNPIKQPTVFMRRRVVETLGGVDTNLRYVMDREFWLRAGVQFRFGYLSGPFLACFRLCPGTKSFDHTPKFRLEWLEVLRAAQHEPAFHEISAAAWKRAIKNNQAGYFFALMLQAINDRKRADMLRHFLAAIRQDRKLFLNRGVWLFLGYGLLGLPLDKYRRFQKKSIP